KTVQREIDEAIRDIISRHLSSS
ncbi:TPA: hypothetical protein ACH3I4_004547, partial [Shigella flexneri]